MIHYFIISACVYLCIYIVYFVSFCIFMNIEYRYIFIVIFKNTAS